MTGETSRVRTTVDAAITTAVNAIHTATTAINTHGPDSTQARTAYQNAINATLTARHHGATDHDIRSGEGRLRPRPDHLTTSREPVGPHPHRQEETLVPDQTSRIRINLGDRTPRQPAVAKAQPETFETIRYTADVVALTPDGHVLLIERGWPPFAGAWALPGGHTDRGETSLQAAVRELGEETGIHVTTTDLHEIGVFDRPDRDPRGRFVTVAYLATVPAGTAALAGDDAVDARWWPLGDLPELAFDHADIIARHLRTTTPA